MLEAKIFNRPRPTQSIIEAATGADILIHEVIGLDDKANQPWGKSKARPIDFGDVASYFHTTTRQLAEIANAARPGILVLYHEQNWSTPYDAEALVDEIQRFGYEGKIISSQDQDIY